MNMDGWNWQDAVNTADVAVHMNWPGRTSGRFDFATFTFSRSPNKNYDKQVATVSSLLDDVASYAAISGKERNLKLEAMVGLLDGSKVLMIHSNGPNEIVEAVKMAQQKGVKKVAMVTGTGALLVKEFLADNNIPVVVQRVHSMPDRADMDVDLPYRLPVELTKAGVKVALSHTGMLALARNLPFYAGTAAAYGLSKEEALKLIRQINKLNNRYSKEYEGAIKQVTAELEKENICLVNHVQLDEEQQLFVDSFYQQRLNGFISPVWLKSVKQLGNEADENIFLAVKMRKEGHKVGEYAIIELPVAQAGRFIRLPDKDGKNYLMYLDDVVRYCLPLIFHGMNYKHFEAYAFKFTKDAEMEIDNDLRNGMMQKISKGVKSRKRGEPLRVIYDASMPKDLLKRVMNKLNLDKLDTVLGGGKYHNHKDLMRFPDCGRKDLKYPEWTPVLKNELSGNVGMLELIRRKDRFIHVPYHSFDSYIRILQEAAINKEVKSIKTTLYRLAKDSKVVKALINAARNGKKVTVVIELLARFDEASNIDWSKKMQDAGIRVIFGVEGLKVHSKITYISMKTGADIACISTGNFHEGNARMYTDYMLMTAAKNVTRDVSLVFDFIERPYSPVRFKELLVSPNEMKQKFSRLINEEIKNKQAGKPAYILIKINHITDPVMVKKLYEASSHGVRIDLLVRGNCSLITGVPGVSDTIRINGIIDRYLEHSRIFIFANGGDEKMFIGSADWMPRNLDNRVEVIAPVYDPEIKADLKRVVEYGLKDTLQGRVVDGTGENRPWISEDKTAFRSQEELYKYYLNENRIKD